MEVMESMKIDPDSEEDVSGSSPGSSGSGSSVCLHWCLGESVMRSLFEKGRFNHILEKVRFFKDISNLKNKVVF